jgi:hypothetical protein
VAAQSRLSALEYFVIPAPVTDLLAALRTVPGVLGVDVHRSGANGARTLRVELAPDLDDRSVVSDVGRLLAERVPPGPEVGGTQIEQNGSAARTEPGRRPMIERVHVVASGLTVTANVSLSVGARIVTGESTGTATQAGASRALATAALRALESLVAGRAKFEMEQIEFPAGSLPSALVSVTMATAEGGERLTGVAAVRGDLRQAVLRATLDAVNRRIDLLLS